MPYSTDNNYTPDTFQDLITRFMLGVNSFFGTDFTYTQFVGTGFYKLFFVIAQQILSAENTFAECYTKLQDYIRTTNETIAIPKTPRQGLIDTFAAAGYTISLEPQTADNAGTLGVCVDVDPLSGEFADQKQEILQMLADYTVAGLYYAGTQKGNVRLSNGQDFEFAFYTPTRTELTLKLTVKVSQNTTILADNEGTIKEKLLANFAQLYRLGNDFEPEKYFTISRDAPYASEVLLEWKTTGDFSSDVLEAQFTDLFVLSADNITVVISNAAEL